MKLISFSSKKFRNLMVIKIRFSMHSIEIILKLSSLS